MKKEKVLQRRDRSGEIRWQVLWRRKRFCRGGTGQERLGDKSCEEGKGLAEEGQVRRIGDKPCWDGKGLAEEGLVRRISDKPCGDGKGSCRWGTGQKIIGDKPCGDGKGLAEEGQVRRLDDKPCGDEKVLQRRSMHRIGSSEDEKVLQMQRRDRSKR